MNSAESPLRADMIPYMKMKLEIMVKKIAIPTKNFEPCL